MNHGRIGFSDNKLILNEAYNFNNFEVHILLDKTMIPYIRAAGIMIGQEKYILKPGEFQLLPHMYFKAVDKKGDLVQLLVNFGDQIGKRNKKASSPIVDLKKG